jgi:flagellin-like protein
MNLSKGIEPIIAVVILIAVTLVIAIGVIGWIMGWWGTLGATEVLQIFPDSKIIIYDGTPTLELHIQNKGTADSAINKIEVAGKTITKFNNSNYCPPVVSVANERLIIKPGVDVTIYITLSNVGATPGIAYSLTIYTTVGNKFSSVIQASSGTVPTTGCKVS